MKLSHFQSRIRASMRYRSFHLYCKLLRAAKTPFITIQERPVDPTLPTLVTLCGERDIDLLRASIASLAKHQEKLPQLQVFADCERSVQRLNRSLQKNNPWLSVQNWDSCLDHLPQAHASFVTGVLANSLEQVSIKKLAVLTAVNRSQALYFSDSDVLWNAPLFNFAKFDPTIARMSLDRARAYNSEFESLLDPSGRLASHPPLNSGVVYFPKASLCTVLTEGLIESLIPHTGKFIWHAEQTMIAHAFISLNGVPFSQHEVANTVDDDFAFRSGTRPLLRHYAGCKHLFWRDFNP